MSRATPKWGGRDEGWSELTRLETQFTYSSEQAEQICRAVDLIDKQECSEFVERVTDMANYYLALKAGVNMEATWGQTRAALRVVARKARELDELLSNLDSATEATLEDAGSNNLDTETHAWIRFRSLQEDLSEFRSATLGELRGFIERASAVASDDKKVGRRKDEAIRWLLENLLDVFPSPAPKRSYSAYTREDSSPFHPLAKAVVGAVDSKRLVGLDDIIREVLSPGYGEKGT